MFRQKLTWSACIVLICVLAIAQAPDLPWEELPAHTVPPQADLKSCQSHFIAYSLILYGERSIDEFTQLESEVRVKIEEIAGGATVNHEHWKRAVEQLTNGKFLLEEKSHASVKAAFDYVKQCVSDPERIRAAGTSIDSIMTSDGNLKFYPQGHVITFLNPYTNASTTHVLVVNSCENRNGRMCYTVSKYKASESEIGLKDFGSASFLTYQIVRKN